MFPNDVSLYSTANDLRPKMAPKKGPQKILDRINNPHCQLLFNI